MEPAQGFAAEAATTATILASSTVGFALSTTQVASGSVIGTGLGRKGASVRWRTAGRIAAGWVITIPAAAIVSGLAALLVSAGFWGIVAVTVAAAAAILGIFLYSRRNRVDHRSFHRPEPGVFVAPKQRRPKKPKRAPKPLQVKSKQQPKKSSKKKNKGKSKKGGKS